MVEVEESRYGLVRIVEAVCRRNAALTLAITDTLQVTGAKEKLEIIQGYLSGQEQYLPAETDKK